jgi:hypothetical protein
MFGTKYISSKNSTPLLTKWQRNTLSVKKNIILNIEY